MNLSKIPKYKAQAHKLDALHPSGIRKMFARAQGLEGVISLGIGAPDLQPPKKLIQFTQELAETHKPHSYTLNAGIIELRDKIISQYQELYNLDYEREGIVVTVGGTQLMYTMIMAMTDPGDEVIIPDPGFVYYSTIPLIAGAKVKPVALNDEFELDPDAIAEKITDKTRMIIINTPSNPTGAVFSESILKGIADLAIDNNISIMSDEAYEFITFGNNVHHPMALYAPDNTVTLNTFSKTYCVPGWRLGYGIGNVDIMKPIAKLHPFIVANPPSLSQYAVAKFMGTPEDKEFRTSMAKTMEQRAKVTEREFSKIPGIAVPPIKGSFYAFPKVEDSTAVNPGEDFVESVFNKAKVVMVPASEFGATRHEHFRVSFGSASEEQISESVQRIRENVEN